MFSSGFYSGSIFHVLRRLYKIIKGTKHGRGGLRSNPDMFSCSQVASLQGVLFQVFRSLRKIKRASRSLLKQVFKVGSFLVHVSILREIKGPKLSSKMDPQNGHTWGSKMDHTRCHFRGHFGDMFCTCFILVLYVFYTCLYMFYICFHTCFLLKKP